MKKKTTEELREAVRVHCTAFDRVEFDAMLDALIARAMKDGAAQSSQVSLLYAAADDAACSVLDELTVTAGILWVCECGWRNPTSDPKCEECGKAWEEESK